MRADIGLDKCRRTYAGFSTVSPLASLTRRIPCLLSATRTQECCTNYVTALEAMPL